MVGKRPPFTKFVRMRSTYTVAPICDYDQELITLKGTTWRACSILHPKKDYIALTPERQRHAVPPQVYMWPRSQVKLKS